MLEIVACLMAVAVVLLFVIAKLLSELVAELKSFQELLWSQSEEPELTTDNDAVRQYISQMLDADIELQRRKFWNGH